MASRACILALAQLLLACPGSGATTTDQAPGSSSDATDGTAGTIGDSTTGTTVAPTTTAGVGDTLDTTSTTTTTATGQTTTTTGTTLGETTTTTTGTTGDDLCGNGVLDPGEACDDGDRDEDDLCLSSCILGPGHQGELLPLPALPQQQAWYCFTAIDEALLPGSEHALVLGSSGWQGQQYIAQIRRLNLPAGEPEWTWTGDAAPNGLDPWHAVTASNGDIIVAGVVWTEIVKPDTGGYLWIARFSPDGAPVWDHRLPDIGIAPNDLEIAPNGDFVLVGNSVGFTGGITTAQVHRFDGDGDLLWSFAEDSLEFPQITRYAGVTADADAVYLAGPRYQATDDLPLDFRVHVRAFASDGTPLWQLDRSPGEPAGVEVGDIVLTGDRLMVSVTRYSIEGLEEPGSPEHDLLAIDLDGDELWWKEWSVPAPWRVYPGLLVPASGGGAFLVASAVFGDQKAHSIARLDPDGEPVWTRLAPGEHVYDALFGPDARLHVLSKNAVTSYTP
ncbi:hypothetical protein OV090_36995 [Nannocystis sp. RBIL2]|uniref:hypothetical protein n=1 Tax=Nannocystis sp. RBIL2 TaxID=2996788 RepID=UPI002271278C|nr:hypothetical protein [Nannocystis sp. RBIL2]MCY1070397.1 hypothetical protein [Nannocystis sp. RBIL2]